MQSDPRIISVHVDELSASVEDWEHRSGAAFESAENAMRQSAELVRQAQSTTTMAIEDARADEAAAERLATETMALRQRCDEVLRLATAAGETAAAMLRSAHSTLTRWQGKLAAAHDWLQRAISAERQAQAALTEAEGSLSHAHAQLNSAHAALNAARSRTEYAGKDSQGRDIYRPVDTTGFVAAVEHAQQQVNYWTGQVQSAQAALATAQADRAAANQRVNACTHSVGLAREGGQCAAAAMDAAHAAMSAAERAQEERSCAELIVAQARTDAHEEARAAGEAAVEVGAARSIYAAAEQHHALAHDLYENARQRSSQYRLEISWRLSRLRAFDQPIYEF